MANMIRERGGRDARGGRRQVRAPSRARGSRPRTRPSSCAGSSTTTSSQPAAGRTAWRTTASRSGPTGTRATEPNVHLFHYADMWNDLDSEMRRVAAALGVTSTRRAGRASWKPPRSSSMRARASKAAPDAHLGPVAVAGGVLPRRRHARLGVAADARRRSQHFDERLHALAGDAYDWVVTAEEQGRSLTTPGWRATSIALAELGRRARQRMTSPLSMRSRADAIGSSSSAPAFGIDARGRCRRSSRRPASTTTWRPVVSWVTRPAGGVELAVEQRLVTRLEAGQERVEQLLVVDRPPARPARAGWSSPATGPMGSRLPSSRC